MLSCSVISDSLCPHGLRGSSVLRAPPPGKNTGVSCHALLQGIVPTQGLNPGLPHCGWIFYNLSHQGSPRILECVAYPFSRGPSRPRNRTQGLLHCRRILYHLSHQGSPYSHYIDNIHYIIKKKIVYIIYYVHEFQLHGKRKWLEILDFVHAWVLVSIVPISCISLLYVFICSLFII